MPSTFPIVLPSEIQTDFPPIDKPTDYTGRCTATGFPAPELVARMSSKGCPYTTSNSMIDMHTGEVAIKIKQVIKMCRNATIYCYLKECDNIDICPPHREMTLHTSTSELLG